jgi:membrane protein DedA with SNARE-associated domain
VTSRSAENLDGLVGVAARAMDALGEWGVGLFTLAETIFPPIPSEVILPLAGFLTKQGTMNMVLVFFTSTLGGYVGALFLYWLGARLGLERSIRWLSRLPLTEREDFEKAADWFKRHGRSAVFFGRLVPGVRSLISLPAGAEKMNLLTFSGFTLAGSGIWNGLLIGLGALLGSQYRLIEQYSRFLNYAVYAALAATVAWLVIRKVRKRKVRDGRQAVPDEAQDEAQDEASDEAPDETPEGKARTE